MLAALLLVFACVPGVLCENEDEACHASNATGEACDASSTSGAAMLQQRSNSQDLGDIAEDETGEGSNSQDLGDIAEEETGEGSNSSQDLGDIAEDETGEGKTCFGKLAGLAADEGGHVGSRYARDQGTCEKKCSETWSCKSASFCKGWKGCFLKSKTITGSEPTIKKSDCFTLYKKDCSGGGPAPPKTPAPTPAKTPAPTPAMTDPCYAKLNGGLAKYEGKGVGARSTKDANVCTSACSKKAECNSISFCPKWSGCWLKDKVMTGSEVTTGGKGGYCVTYYKKPECRAPAPTPAPWRPPPPAGSYLRVMSYNMQYTGFSDGRLGDYAGKIKEVGAAIVGTQETQKKYDLASWSGYKLVPGTDFQNPIYYNDNKVSFVDGSSGWTKILRDRHSPRTLTWAKFRFGSTELLFFNTHLPHAHGDASSPNSHARIARQLIQKRQDLGAASMPTVVTGDMNSFASNGNWEGTFQSVLEKNGFELSYKARGHPGHAGLDKILASSQWISSNGKDRGTGRSDHPAITADLTLKR